jgi:hypothetical protein
METFTRWLFLISVGITVIMTVWAMINPRYIFSFMSAYDFLGMFIGLVILWGFWHSTKKSKPKQKDPLGIRDEDGH